MAERFDSDLGRAPDAAAVVPWRRVALVEWFFERFGAHVPQDRIPRDEDIVADAPARPGDCAPGTPA